MKQCFECEKTEDQIEIHDHHVVPKSKGGTKTIPLCYECHGLVHGKNTMNIKALTKNALAAKKKQGFRVGTVPFGFSALEDGKLVENDSEQLVCELVRTARASKTTWTQTAQDLNEKGFTNRAGRSWTKQNAYLIFRNKIKSPEKKIAGFSSQYELFIYERGSKP
jgi:hypothetical protein